MASKNWPGPDLQGDKFMGLEVQIPWPALLVPSVPDAASVFSAAPRMLSEPSGPHECLSVGSALSPSVGPAPGGRLLDWTWIRGVAGTSGQSTRATSQLDGNGPLG